MPINEESIGSQQETLEQRLAKRRQCRNRRFLDKKSIGEESEIKSKTDSPIKSQSLDRKSSTRITSTKKLSSTVTNQNSNPRKDSLLSDSKTNSTPHLRNPSIDSDHEKQSSSKSLSSTEQQNENSSINRNAVSSEPLPVIPFTSAKPPIPKEKQFRIRSSSHDDEKFTETKEMSPITLPSITPRLNSGKLNSASQEIYQNPNLKRIRENLHTPPSHPQSSTFKEETHFDFPPSALKPIVRSTSEKTISNNTHNHPLIHTKYAKVNTLALAYIFTKRMVDLELTRKSSSEQEQEKTAWD